MTRAGAGTARVASPRGAGTARSSLTVAGWTTVSRVTGLLRVVAVGAVFGPTWFANVFQSTNQVPNLLYEVMAGPVLALVVVPAVVRARAPGSAADHRHLVDGLTGLLLAAAAGLALAIVVAAPAVAWVLTTGVDDPAVADRAFRVAVLLLCCVAPQVPLYTLAYLGAAAQQARQRFALAAAAPAVENLGLVAVVLAILVVRGPGMDVGTAPVGAVLALGAGATAAVALHAGLQCWGAARAGTTMRPRWRRHDPEVGVVVRRLRGSVRVAALPAAGVFVLLAVASTVPGGVPVFWLAYSIGAVPTALGARAVATAVLPGLSRAAHDDDGAAFARGWRQGAGYAAFVGVGAAVVLVALAGPLAAVLAAGELHTREVVASLAVCVAVIGVSQVFGGTYEMGRQALFARLDVRGARFATDVGTVLGTAVGVAALAAAPALRPALLCVAVLVRDAGCTVLVLARLRRTLPGRALVARPALLALGAGVVVAVPVALAARALLDVVAPGELLAVAALAAAGLVVVGVYAATLRATLRGVVSRTGRPAW
ncbi:lipid II flippase MurJ [Actinomycetospora chiangmaiensis]|uniref:lipid II flippase MurJ n=1 Tax=Actinomycetospora chiangmaiensis TaxID=402650 RepID=UPI0003A00D55|nr:lipid II flippase MurJ [Actinomycetospora chiangmaiensis]